MFDILEFMGRLWYIMIGTVFSVFLLFLSVFIAVTWYVSFRQNQERVARAKSGSKTESDDELKTL